MHVFLEPSDSIATLKSRILELGIFNCEKHHIHVGKHTDETKMSDCFPAKKTKLDECWFKEGSKANLYHMLQV